MTRASSFIHLLFSTKKKIEHLANNFHFEMSKTAVINTKGQNVLIMRDQSQMILCEVTEQTCNFSRQIKKVSPSYRLDLQSIQTSYCQWINSKASEHSCVIISINPDPFLNRKSSTLKP